MWSAHKSPLGHKIKPLTRAFCKIFFRRGQHAAVDQLILAMALAHVGDGTRANTVLPGHIETPLVMQRLHDDIILPQPQ